MRNRFELIAAAVLMTALVGCTDDADTPSAEPSRLAPDGFDIAPSDSNGALPAWQTAAEREAAKADRLDPRGEWEDVYGVSAPPNGTSRAVAEFERSDAVLVDWDAYLESFMVDLVDAIDESAPLYIMTDSVSESRRVSEQLERRGVDIDRINFFEFRNDAFWTRDYGPIPVALEDGTPGFVDARYYPNRRRDDAVPTLMSRYFGVDAYRPDLATEGGNFMTNGEGLCVVTEWLLQENPNLSRTQVETIKRDYFGCQRLVVLERMDGEGTGHVDMFAKFLDEDTVMVGSYDPIEEPQNAGILDRNADRLREIRLADGSNLEVVRVPMPRADYPVFRSYTNSLIVNDTVVVPIYEADRRFESRALQVYRDNMPAGYRIVTVPADDVIELGGAVHCTTMGFALQSLRPGSDVDPGSNPDEPEEPEEPEEPQPEGPTADDVWSSTPDLAVLDGERTSDTIVVDGPISASEVLVTVDIDHSYVGDLRVYIEWNGYEVVLQEFAGGSSQGLQQTYTIEGLDGMDASGAWTLHVEDHQDMDEGTLREWSLQFQ